MNEVPSSGLKQLIFVCGLISGHESGDGRME
jgi:hypothetical protein